MKNEVKEQSFILMAAFEFHIDNRHDFFLVSG